MRYLGHFPSEAQVRDHVLPEIEEDEPSENINYKKFEPYMLRVLKEGEYKPDDPETLLAAFKILDPEGKGFIEIDEIKRHLETQGIEFASKETQDFIDFATSKDPNATVIYYEDYLSRLYSFIDKHLEGVMKGYSTFKPKI